MQSQNVTNHLSREQIIDKTVFRIAREFAQPRSPEEAFIQYIKNSQTYNTEYRN